MQYKGSTTLPITKHRASESLVLAFHLINGMEVDVIKTQQGVSSVHASTLISDHPSIDEAKLFLTELEKLNVYEGVQLNFSKIREFAHKYSRNS